MQEGETVTVNSVVATIGAARRWRIQPLQSRTPSPDPDPDRDPGSRPLARFSRGPDIVDAPHAKPAAASRKSNGRAGSSKPGEDDARTQRSSPLVRRIARDNDVDISQIHGSGLGGRVTKNDILGFIETGSQEPGPGIGGNRDWGFARTVNRP